MSRRRTITGLGVAAATVLALSLAAAPVGAHTGFLFTATGFQDPAASRFATINATNAAVAPLAGGPSSQARVEGMDISGEVAYGILGRYSEESVPQIITWDHNTGAVVSAVNITLGVPGLVLDVWALDTTNDGTLLAFADVEVEDGEFDVPETWVVSINPATGVATPVVEVTALQDNEDELFLDSLATNPITGTTFMFFDYDDGLPLASVLDLVGGTFSEPFIVTEVQDTLGDGYMAGADYDTAGTLWFYYTIFSEEEGDNTVVLASTPGDVTAESSPVSSGTASDVALTNLTYDPYVAQLAATGLPVAGYVLGGAVLLGLGVLGVAVTRRRTA